MKRLLLLLGFVFTSFYSFAEEYAKTYVGIGSNILEEAFVDDNKVYSIEYTAGGVVKQFYSFGHQVSINLDKFEFNGSTVKPYWISKEAFKDNTDLISINAPYVEHIGESAFSGCLNLRSCSFYVSGEAFKQSDLNYIGPFAFYGCSSLESFYLPSKSYNPIVIACEISRFAFADCTNLKDLTVNHYCYIRASAFENCHSLSNVSITSCELIESRAFSGCCSLNAFSIPGNVSLLGDSVFHNCINLSFLDIPEKVKQIGNDIISGCISLKKVFSNISNPFFVSDWGIDVSGITLYVPEAAIAYYVLFDCWNQFKSIYGVIDSSYSVDDVNRDGSIDISDVVYLVNRILNQ